jgi:hypothetical protein
MKNRFLYLAIFQAFFLFSCKDTSEKSSSVKPNGCTEYACPMHPDHTSTVPAKCPECNMEMDSIKVKIKKDSVLIH